MIQLLGFYLLAGTLAGFLKRMPTRKHHDTPATRRFLTRKHLALSMDSSDIHASAHWSPVAPTGRYVVRSPASASGQEEEHVHDHLD
jgi:hypothetical protein